MRWKLAAMVSLASILVLAGCNATRTPTVVVKSPPAAALDAAPLRWHLPAPTATPLDIRGVANMDDAGLDAGAPLYPGGNAGTFLMAIFTHAAVADAAHESQKAKLQVEADKVLLPYLPIVDNFEYRDVMRSAVTQMTVEGEKVLIDAPGSLEAGWLATIQPVFMMTQDERAILMEGVVTLFAPEDREAPYYRNLVRIVSLPVTSADPEKHWLEAEGKKLHTQLASLVARGLDVAITDATVRRTAEEEAHRTFRYNEGSSERIERAQLLERTCNRMLLKTLRGHLYLVPVMDMAVAETPRTAICDTDKKTAGIAG